MKKIMFILFLLPVAIPLAARDFDVVTPSGHTIYCDVVQGGAKVVGWNWERSDMSETARLTLPPYVRNGDVNLRLVAIGDSCFRFYWNLLSVEIPSTVKTIGRAAFSWCYGLGSISVPQSVDSIGTDAFFLVPNVEYNGTAQGAPWGAYNMNAYHEGQYYYSDNRKTHIVCCSRDITEATILPTVTSIGERAFAACVNITSLKIDSTVRNIGERAFSNCTGLESLFYNPQWRPADLDEGAGIFSDCINLREVTFGKSVNVVPYKFCYNCRSLREIAFPDNITEIKNQAFEKCSSLREIVFDFKGEGTVGNFVFDYCRSVFRIVCMNDTVPRFYTYPFGMSTETGSVDPDVVTFYVPCGTEDVYSQAHGLYLFDNSNFEGKPYYVVATANNRRWGWVDVVQPTCSDNIAIMEALPEEGYRFVRWDDGNTDNPRVINYTGSGYVYRKAIFESSSGIQALDASPDVRVYTSYGNIVIEGAAGEQASLFDVMGRRILSTKVYGSPYSILRRQLPGAGVYIVKIGSNRAEKILLTK